MKRQALSDFAVANPGKRPGLTAWLSTIPEFDEVIAAWREGVSAPTIRRWLVLECEYSHEQVTRARIDGYLQREYPRDGA